MRGAREIVIEADDPIAGAELAALAAQNGWYFSEMGQDRYLLSHPDSAPESRRI